MQLKIEVIRRYMYLLFLGLFFFYSLAIVCLHILYPEKTDFLFQIYTDSYGLIAAIGGLLGLSYYRRWGGFNSIVGKSLIFLSLGLLFQFLGQISYAFFRYAYDIEVAYPSFGEIFYFGSIPLYIIGTWFISVAAGIKVRLRRTIPRLLSFAFILTATALSMLISYSLFLSSYDFSDPDFVVVFLELGYPFGQAISVSFTILAYFLSRNILGGKMKGTVLVLLVALILQYIADVYYTYDIYTEIFYSGGLSDYLYILAYTVMGIGLFRLGVVPDKIPPPTQNKK